MHPRLICAFPVLPPRTPHEPREPDEAPPPTEREPSRRPPAGPAPLPGPSSSPAFPAPAFDEAEDDGASEALDEAGS